MTKKHANSIIIIIIGAFLFALGVNVFVIPNDFGEGGVTGLTIILYYLFKWSPGITNLILNGVLLIIGYKFLDKLTIIYTIIAIIFNSLFLHLTASWHIASDQLMINAIFGALVIGLGIGLILYAGGTTAGSAIMARIMNKHFDWNVSYALLFFDLIVVFASFFVIGVQSLMFTIVMLYIATKVIDFVVEGLNPRKAITIITEDKKAIADEVNQTMDRGVTIFSGYGHYTGAAKDVLYIVITKQEVSKLKKIIKRTDPDAFVTIHDVRDVFGKGFVDM